jgi:hypothetical protein
VHLRSQQSGCRPALGPVLTPADGYYGQLHSLPSAPPDVSPRLHSLLELCLARKLKLPAKVRRLLPKACFLDVSPESYAVFARVLVSLAISLSAGASTIIPMVLIVLSPSLARSLVVVGVAVSFFGIALAAMARMRGSQVFLMTAAYAVVLTLSVAMSSRGTSF